MISLQDKILKFQKLLYNKQLEEFIPIDEQFIGEGITMESLIKENAFILQEIKKMKNVFVNYCKLNNTVYEKITEHQIALHTETQKMQDLSHTVQNKLNESVKQFKQMYEEMQYQSQRTNQLVKQAIRPIEEAVKNKVDETSFARQIKKLIYEFGDGESNEDGMGIDGIDGVEGSNLQGNGFSLEGGTFRKRKAKAVSSQEYLMQREKNAKVFLQLSQKIEEMQSKLQQNDPILYRNTSNISKLILQADGHENEIFRLNRDSKETRSLIISSQQKLLSEISARTSDFIWQKKFNAFQTTHVAPMLQALSNQFNHNQKENQKKFDSTQLRLNKISQDTKLLAHHSQEKKRMIKKIQKNIQNLTNKLHDEIAAIEQKLRVVDKDKQDKLDKMNLKMNTQISTRSKEIQSLQTTIKDLSKTIEEKILNAVRKNIEVKLGEIDKNIHSLTMKEKAVQDQILTIKGQIHSIKEILSKKANFTDILLQFERKADKEDFRQLKDKIQTTPSYIRSTILDSPEKTRRTISANSKKRTSISKNLILPNQDKSSLESQNQMSSRLFIMGLDNDMISNGDRRRLSYTECTRRKKKMKSMAGMLNMFQNQ